MNITYLSGWFIYLAHLEPRDLWAMCQGSPLLMRVDVIESTHAFDEMLTSYVREQYKQLHVRHHHGPNDVRPPIDNPNPYQLTPQLIQEMTNGILAHIDTLRLRLEIDMPVAWLRWHR